MEIDGKKKEQIEGDVNKSEEGEGAEEEEAKMDKFFALIRNFRDARSRRMKELKELNPTKTCTNNKKKRKAGEEQSSWVPSFQLEDFSQEIQFRSPPLVFPPAHIQQHINTDDVKKDKDSGLDLRLGL